MPLEQLAPELLSLILQSADSPRDLHAIISAIPACLQIFRTAPEITLSSVLQNAITPDALPHALAILYVPEPPKDENDDIDVVAEAIDPFLKMYFQGGVFEFPRGMTSIIELSRLYLRISAFIDDYVARALGSLGVAEYQPRDPDGGSKAQAAPVSYMERTRLQRAFFRYELYSRVFALDFDSWGGSVLPSSLQFSRFVERLKTWEVEEMSCVNHYFTSTIGGFLDELEEQIVEDVLTAPGARVPEEVLASLPPELAAKVHSIRATYPAEEQEMVAFECLGLPDLVLFSTSGRIRSPNYLTYMASLGSSLVHRLIFAPSAQRKAIIRSNTPLWRDFLPDALEHAPTTGRRALSLVFDDYGVSVSQPNLAWFLFRRSATDTYARIHAEGVLNAPLRERGYVFWDAARVRDGRVSAGLRTAKDMPSEEVNRRYNRFMGVSAEKRLKGVLIPRVEMERINAEFGSTFEHF